MLPQTKTCRKCGQVKPLTDFYVHPAAGDGRMNKCKECTKADVRANYAANAEQYREYEKTRANLPHRVALRAQYQQTPIGRQAATSAKRRYIERNPDKRHAHNLVAAALKDGRIQRQPCEACGDDAQAHHDDYGKPLDVRWLCPKHHAEHHRKERESA